MEIYVFILIKNPTDIESSKSQLKVVTTMVARLIAAALGECLVQMMRVLIQMEMLVLAKT